MSTFSLGAWLANHVDPAAPAAALVLTVFLAIYLVRRFWPSAWLLIESKIPFVDSLDYRPIATIVWKFFQALPGALLGAAVASLSSGASVRNALLGVAAGFGASLVHEVMAAYQGEVGGPTKLPPPGAFKSDGLDDIKLPAPPKPPSGVSPFSAAGIALVLAVSLTGCAAFAAAVPIIAEVGTIIADGVNDLDLVEEIVATFPGLNDATKANIASKLDAARLALQAAAAADSGASALTADQLDASLANFRTAWNDLDAALKDAGIVTGAKLGASLGGGELVVPQPLALKHFGGAS